MSAIVGRISLTGEHVGEVQFAASLATLSHYGVNGSAVVAGDSFRVGIQRLNLTHQTDAELLPIKSGKTVIVADCILNNREELGVALGYKVSEVASLSDVKLLDKSFEKWGYGCPSHILGDYAFAVFDHEARRLFLTRDNVGTRPLYWSERNGTIIFGTDIRAIVANKDFDWPVDERAVARYVMNPGRPQDSTFFKHIYSVPPATGLQIDQTGVREIRWWSPHGVPEFHYKTLEEYNDHFRSLMEQLSVEYTASRGNIGAHFSGGIDSCSTTAFATKALELRGRSLAAGYCWAPEVSPQYPLMGKRDERRIVQTLGAKLGITVRYRSAEQPDPLRILNMEMEFDGISDLHDEIPVLELAAADGLSVLLSGWGGDEAYSSHGAGYLSYALKTGKLSEARKALRFHTNIRRFRPLKTFREFLKSGIVPMLPDSIYRHFSPFVDIFEGGAFPTRRTVALAPEPTKFPGSDIRLISDPRAFVANYLIAGHLSMRMETWAAWSAQFGFQYRYPLLDRRILEFILGMPRYLFMADGQSRYLARTVVKGLVPDGLNKYDLANELLRSNSRLDNWRLLKGDLSRGAFEGESAWVDMNELRKAIADVPDSMDAEELKKFAKILAALRVWKMEQRLQFDPN